MTAVPRSERLARWCLRQAVWPPAILAGAGTLACVLLPGGPTLVPRHLAGAIFLAAALATLGLSVLILFDALLFRLMASYEDGDKGGAAVDDILARMRLKPLPMLTRSLDARAAGTHRLVWRQRTACALALAAAACAVLA